MTNGRMLRGDMTQTEGAPLFVRLLFVFAGVVSASFVMLSPSSGSALVAMFCALVLCIYMACVSRRNWLLLISFLFLAYCIYSIICAQYLDLVGYTPYNAFANTAIAWEGAAVMLLFVLSLSVTLPLTIPRFPVHAVRSERASDVIVYVCVAVVILAGLFGLEGSGDRQRMSSSLYEYSVILLIIGLYFASDNKAHRILLLLALLFRIYVDFSSGNRVTALEMVTALFIMRFAWCARLSIILPLGILLFVVLMGVGALRGSSFSLETVFEALSRLAGERAFAWDGAYSAYHTSLAMLATESYYPLADRVAAFPSFLLSISIVPTDMTGLANPTALVQERFWNMGGTYFPFFFHFYLGVPGVLMSSLVLGAVLRRIALIGGSLQQLSPTRQLVVIWIGSSMFRWAQYEATSLVRGVLLTALATYFISSVLAHRENETPVKSTGRAERAPLERGSRWAKPRNGK